MARTWTEQSTMAGVTQIVMHWRGCDSLLLLVSWILLLLFFFFFFFLRAGWGVGWGLVCSLIFFFFFFDGKSVMPMFCNVMLLLLYVHVCVTRTGWKTRPRPKTVILLIKQSINQSINQSIFCVPQLYLWGSPFWGEIFSYVTAF